MDANKYYLELMFIFLNIFQLQKLMKKFILTKTLFLRKKDKILQQKKLGCRFIRINTSKYYDEDYEIGRIQTFIKKYKNGQLKKLEKESNTKLKELEHKIREFKLQLTSQITQ